MKTNKMLNDKKILLIISGGIAAYKGLELIRLIRKSGGDVHVILTEGGAKFITPLSAEALSQNKVYSNLWSQDDQAGMDHIRLTREADLIIVAPASANTIKKIAHGDADNLATTTLLAANKPIMIAPAMNPEMWANQATQTNIKTLKQRAITIIDPATGDTACKELGMGRMSEPAVILEALHDFFHERPLKGLRALVTSGPTFEPIDPVRFIGNRSSGKQGHAIATALYEAGADVTLITGPVSIPAPAHIKTIEIETAAEMLKAVQNALPVHTFVCAAAVSDWSPTEIQTHKIKKRKDQKAPSIPLKENQDILKTVSSLADNNRPDIVVGFAAETENIIKNAKEKLSRKNCDIIIANEIKEDESVFGADENHVYMITHDNVEQWDKTSKKAIARKLVQHIVQSLKTKTNKEKNITNAA